MSSSINRDSQSLASTESLRGESQPTGPTDLDNEKTHIRKRPSEFIESAGSSIPSAPSSTNWQSVATSLVGQQLDHFRIDTLVGIGGMGAVFRGQDLRLNREVAIKAIAVEGRDPEALRRFRFEAQSAAKLDHPNIARVYYVGETPYWSYIVFEYVEGVNLRDLVQRQGALGVDHSVFLIRQVAQALEHASQRQVVHRDIKPSNIVLAPTGQAKIVDMGLARFTEMDRSTNDLTASGVTLGTFDYISPEQANDPRDADVRSDLYSLGCTWYYLLTGSPPFPEGTALQKLLMHGSKMPEDPRGFRSDLSDSLIAILRKLIAKRPIDRYQSPIDLIDDLQTLAIMENLEWTRNSDPREKQPDERLPIWRFLVPHIAALGLIFAISIWLYAEWIRAANTSISRLVVSESPAEFPETPNDGSLANRVDVSSIISLPASTQSLLIDGSFTNEQLETNRQLAGSLDQAIERANLATGINQFEIQSPKLTSTDSLKSLNRNRARLSIVSQEGQRSRIEIDTTGKELRETKSWFDCGSSHLTLKDVDIVWKTSDARQSLFLCRPSSQLNLEGCSIRVEFSSNTNSTSLPAIVQCEQNSMGTAGSVAVSSIASISLNFSNSLIVGSADVVRYTALTRLEGKWKNSIVAVAGSAIEISRVSFTPSRPVGSIRLSLESMTSWTSRSWLHATWMSNSVGIVPIIRQAENCIFAGMESFVVWDVSANEDWQFWEQNNRGQDLTRWIDLRGKDNFYDENLRQLVEANLQNGMMEQLMFSTDTKLLAEERGIEFSIPWVKRPSSDQILSGPFKIECFELHESEFPRGANLKTLAEQLKRQKE